MAQFGQQIFHDPSGRRGRWVRGGAALTAILITIATALLLGTVVMTPSSPPLPMPHDAVKPYALPMQAPTPVARPWLPAARSDGPRPEVMAFYMPWDDNARISLETNIGTLDWLAPGLATVSGPRHRFAYAPDPHLRRVLANRADRPRLLPMVQNATEAGDWDGAGTAAMLADAGARGRFLDQVAAMLAAERAAGIVFDLENLPADVHPHYLRFLREAKARFAPHGWLVTLAVPVADPAWDLAAYAAAADRLFLMAYDEHWPGGDAGPIASQGWFVEAVSKAVKAAGPGKSIVAIGSYAYDWSEGRAEVLTIDSAWRRAHRAGSLPLFDAGSGNSGFAYSVRGRRHDVWTLDAASAWNQLRAAHALGASGVALWRMGSEDPGIWPTIAAFESGTPALDHIATTRAVELDGAGEVLRIAAAATPGARRIRTDADRLIRAMTYHALPTPYVVQRTGNRRRQVALTFDDGPDPRWTPRILDILKAARAPATFFVTGSNAIGQPALLRRILAEGSELGNHSTMHSNLGALPDGLIRLELNATQRVVEAYTGRSLRLFRAPFLGDAEPTTGDELRPAHIAAELGYLTIGLHVDPLDWRAPGADAIVARTIAQVEAGTPQHAAQIVLLHDAGGDRSHTLAALPRIISGLRARGYNLVGVSQLAGLTLGQTMPRVGSGQTVTVGAHHIAFLSLAGAERVIAMLFFVLILLGTIRSLALAGLAWRSRHRTAPGFAPHLVPRFVSVLIPAFNEARVIESSVRRILATCGMRIEVIVIDDGSSDGTSDVVSRAFGIDPRVTLLTIANGGKARALNEGLRIARGDIVVALDADTQFEPDTIAKLARWFADPAIGAVAGNAKIGNAINLITRWQAIEYVTAQNLERRALASLDAVTVVPGAVGAWRRTALDAVGGYPVDTLAEDQDLTIAVQRAGWRVACDIDAVAWTEAPETVHALFKQRFRWAYGTLQCLWKHRSIFAETGPKGLSRIGLPQTWLFQIAFALASPLIDVGLLVSLIATIVRVTTQGWSQAGGDAATMTMFWGAFMAVDLGCGWLAYRLDPRETAFPAFRLLMQRIGYRQLMYAVVIRATIAALSGPRVGWGKLERTGRATAPAPEATSLVVPIPLPAPRLMALDEAA